MCVNVRWFKLEGGEIRYYADESMRPSSLKGTLSLRGCSLPATDEANGDVNITVQRPDGHCLLMIAASPELAGDWRSAIASSISLLLKQEGALLKNRRANIGNVQSDSRTAATSKEVAFALYYCLLFFLFSSSFCCEELSSYSNVYSLSISLCRLCPRRQRPSGRSRRAWTSTSC